MIIRKIDKKEVIESKKLSSICFEYPFDTKGKTDDEYLDETLDSPQSKDDAFYYEKWGAFNEQNEMMSCLSVIPYQFFFDGKWFKGTGIGNVCTYPHHRRKGAVKEIFNHILVDMYDNNVVFSYLYPFSESFYNKFGYSRLTNSICWALNLNMIPDYRYSGTFHLYPDSSSLNDYVAAYNTYASKINMMVLRDDYDWDNLNNAKAYHNNNYAYLYKDQEGEPRGYLIFKKEIRNNEPILNCRELIFDNFDTLKAIMSFVKTYASDYRKFRFHAPIHFNLEYFCKDFSIGNSSMNIASNGMVRVIHVVEALKYATYKESGILTLKISDPYILQNNQTFTVTYHNGKAIEVATTPTDNAFDIEMPIDTFSAAIIGKYNAEDFEYMDNVSIHCSKDKIQNIFYQKPNWINNYF